MMGRALLALVAWLCLLAAPALATERITRFHSELAVLPDGVVEVTETIDLVAEGREIRRGILRDLPTMRSAPDGQRWRTSYRVTSIRQDGAPARHALEHPPGLLRIRIGDPDVLLSPGPHRYEITYRAYAQVRAFAGHDELWWNVTGENWTFPIERAEARLRLPGSGRPDRLLAWQGPRGTQEASAAIRREPDGAVSFGATRALPPGQGLTIVAGWPKGIVTLSGGPGLLERVGGVPALVGTAAAALLLFGVLFAAWLAFGRDPAARAIMPRYAPPEQASPASCRFVRRMHFDNVALAAGLLGLAAKGMVRLEPDPDGVQTVCAQRPAEPVAGMDRPEARLLASLPDARTRLQRPGAAQEGPLSKARRELALTLAETHEGRSFRLNGAAMAVGAVLAVALAVLLAALYGADGLPMSLGLAELATRLGVPGIGEDRDLLVPLGGLTIMAAIVLAMAAWRVPVLHTLVITALVGLAGSFLLVLGVSEFGAYGLLWCLFAVVAFALLAWAWRALPARSPEGQRLFEEIEGFRRFLSLTEADRLAREREPPMTREMFHRFLPYALALDVAAPWALRFAQAVAAGAVAAVPVVTGESAPASDGWATATDWTRPDAAESFGAQMNALVGEVGAAGASAAGESGSGSGFGNGGSSGGGGGGGGGGGW